MATAIVAVGCYYGYTASRRPGGRRPGDRQVDDLEHGAGAPDRHDGLPGLLGGQSEGADRGLTRRALRALRPWTHGVDSTWTGAKSLSPHGGAHVRRGSTRRRTGPRRTIVVMAHGLSGTRRDGLAAFAERFAAAGFAALVFDHRGFGDSSGEPDLFEPARQLEDWRAAIAFARSLPGVDPDRVATFGSSMGGGNALAAAAEDARVAAAISQVPFLDMAARPTGRRRRSSRGCCGRRAGRASARGRAAGRGGVHQRARAPRQAGATSSRSARTRAGATACRHAGCSVRPYAPARHAAQLHCPWLVCVGEADRVAKPGPAIAAARRAPHGELRIYPGVDHFDIYDGPEHEAVVADEIDFLNRHLRAPGQAPGMRPGDAASPRNGRSARRGR